ncbi:MAG TPA: hypothetical protein VG722_06945 [Tepidisphaeraceae bacterium]|nr:hypothetical protein [Tepidisphaeraceae bacterium]
MLAVIHIFTQSLAWGDLPIVGLLVVLEGLLSLDNAVVLGVLAARVPKRQRSRALLYGLVGAFFFRLGAIALAAYLLHWTFLQLVGGIYLAWVAIHYFVFHQVRPSRIVSDPSVPLRRRNFWKAVLAIELTDLAFAADSILAAIALIGPLPPGYPKGSIHPKLWIVVVGGFLGLILMRFAAILFIKLLDRFPRLEASAYLIVLVIAVKMLVEWYFTPAEQPPEWIFWVVLAICFAAGFLPTRKIEGGAGG